jgi:hypothetical protein
LPDILVTEGARARPQTHTNEKIAPPRLMVQVVRKCSDPRWTTTFASRHEYGVQLLLFVDILAVSSGKHVKLGRATFDVEDVLGTTHKIKARRLRNNRGV